MKQTVIISGGKRGIGGATACLLSDSGYQVLNPDSKELDLRSDKSIEEYFAKQLKPNKSSDVYGLVCNAGIHLSKPFLKHSIEEWQNIIDVNLTGTFRLCQKVLPYMLEAGRGRIAVISSVSGLMGEAFGAAYSASKAGLLGLTKSLALEFGNDNITVNAICPGWVHTDMSLAQLNTPGREAAHLGATLQNRWIKAEEIAHLVKYLLSDEAKAITGQAINISAGLSL